MNIPETDQWLLDGDCDKCRREKYCDKECTKAKRATAKVFQNLIDSAMQKRYEKKKEELKNRETNVDKI